MTTINDANREHALAAAAINGDAEAFKAIYELLSLRVFNLVLRSVHERATAEDICQEVWLKAHREIHKLNSPQALRTWLFRMASRACIDYSRSRACRERGSPEVTEEMLDAPADEPERVAERRADLRVMWEALAAMPPRQSLALYLKQVEGCSYDEIGRILGCPKTAVETLLFRARQGFSRVHSELQHDPESSCRLISRTMAAVIDNEATQFQERAVEAHLNECRPCRIQMQTLGRGAAGYAWLPMLPIGQQALLSALAGGAGGAGAGLGIARLVCGLLIKAKAASTIAVVVGAVGTTAVAAGAATGVTPTPGDVVTLVQESVGAGPETAAENPQDDTSEDQGGSSGPGSPNGAPVPGKGGPTVGTSGGLPPAGPADSGGGSTGGVDGTLGGVTDTVNTTLDGAGEVINGTVDGVVDTLNGAIQDVTQTVNELLEDPVGTATGILEDPAGTVDDVTETVDDALGGALDGVDDTLGGTLDGVLPEDENQPAEEPPDEPPPIELPPVELPPVELPPLLPPPDPEEEEESPCIPLVTC